MERFAELLDRLGTTTQRNGKIRLLANYFRVTPDPDRGFALAALTDGLPLRSPCGSCCRDSRAACRSGALSAIARLCRRYGRDRCAAVARGPGERATALAEIVATVPRLDPRIPSVLSAARPAGCQRAAGPCSSFLAAPCGSACRLVSPRSASRNHGRVVEEIEEIWHAVSPPYRSPVRLAGRARASARLRSRPGLQADDAVTRDGRQRPGRHASRRCHRGMEVGRHPCADRFARRSGANVLTRR